MDASARASDSRLEVIPYDECIRLLASAELGRLGVLVDDEPLVLPVNYRWDGSGVVIRTDPGRKLQAAVGHVVVFEIDGVEAATRRGWSVIVRGTARLLAPPEPGDTSAGAAAPAPAGAAEPGRPPPAPVDPEPWAPGPKAHWLRIEAESISGRRITHAEPDEWWRLSASN